MTLPDLHSTSYRGLDKFLMPTLLYMTFQLFGCEHSRITCIPSTSLVCIKSFSTDFQAFANRLLHRLPEIKYRPLRFVRPLVRRFKISPKCHIVANSMQTIRVG